mgnify:CR=1 FL=1
MHLAGLYRSAPPVDPIPQETPLTLTDLFPPLAGKRYHALDGLRGLAVLMIFNTHFLAQYADRDYFLQPGSLPYHLTKTLHSGLVGVDIFFMLSGLLTYLSIFHKHPSAPAFVLGRYRRLLPVIVAVAIPALCFGVATVSTRQIVDNIFFLKLFPETTFVNPVTWALTYEMYFYLLALVWFVLLGRLRLFRGARAFAGLWGLLLANVIFLRRFGVYSDVRFLGFFYGIGLGMLLANETGRRLISQIPWQAWPVCLAGVATCSFAWGYGPTQHIIFTGWWWNFAFYTVLDLAITGLILCLTAMEATGKCSVWGTRPMRLLGIVSYSLFMSHAPWGLPLGRALSVSDASGPGSLAWVYAVSLLASLALATFLFVFLERPYFARRT